MTRLKPFLFSSILMISLLFSAAIKAQDKDDKIYTLDSVNTPPTFKGGMQLFYKQITEGVRYPEEAHIKPLVPEETYKQLVVKATSCVIDSSNLGDRILAKASFIKAFPNSNCP